MADTRPNDEQIKAELIPDKILATIFKRFLETKKDADERCKWVKVDKGINFLCTNLGSSVDIQFKNKFEGSYQPTSDTYYLQYDKSKRVESDQIYEYVEVKEGKTKKLMKTGHLIEFPPVAELFSKYNPSNFKRILLTMDDIEQLIAYHEVVEKAGKSGGQYFACKLGIEDNMLEFSLNDCPFHVDYIHNYTGDSFLYSYYYYNPTNMLNILKSLKDLKIDKVMMYFNGEDPTLFYSQNVDYCFRFAMHKVLVKEV